MSTHLPATTPFINRAVRFSWRPVVLCLGIVGLLRFSSPWTYVFASAAIIAVVVTSPGLRQAIWHARVPTFFATAGVLALVVPEQVRHLLAGTAGLLQILMLFLAVFTTGLGCWFWCRWSLNLAWAGLVISGPKPETAWRWLPRVLAVAPAAAMEIAVWQSSSLLPAETSYALGAAAFVAGASLVLLTWIRPFAKQAVQARRRRKGLDGERSRFFNDGALRQLSVAPRSWREWWDLGLRCLPLSPLHQPWIFVFPVLSGLAAATVFLDCPYVVRIAQWVGPAPTALFGLATLLTILAPIVGVMAARRWPALLLLTLWVVGAAGANVNNAVRTKNADTTRPTLSEAATRWLDHCAEAPRIRQGEATGKPGESTGRVRVVLVAAAGGASRAALWAGSVMSALEASSKGPQLDPGQHVFALSGISGGALGLAAYAATLAESKAGCGGLSSDPAAATGDDAEQAATAARVSRATQRLQTLKDGLGQDYLAPALAGLFFGDAWWRVLGPVSAAVGGLGLQPAERTTWLERSWEDAFGGPAGPLAQGLVQKTFPKADAKPHLPLLFTGGTHLETGRLTVTAPVSEGPNRSSVPGSIDAINELGSDPPFSVAASNSARFPYVTAPGLLRGKTDGVVHGQVVDGGYYDNLGTTALQAAADALEAAHAKLAKTEGHRLFGSTLHLFVVQVWSDPDRSLGAIPGCEISASPEVAVQRPTPLDFLLSPVGALLQVRGERANSGAGPMARRYCPPKPKGDEIVWPHYYAFAMGKDVHDTKPPLNWVLPPETRTSISDPDLNKFPAMKNEVALQTMGHDWCLAGQRAREKCPKSPQQTQTARLP